MHASTLVIGAAALGLLAWGTNASAGWVIDQAAKGGGEGRQQMVLQSNRMKTVVLEPDGKPNLAFIVDLDAETITQVNYADRSYVLAPVREYIDTMRGMQQTVGRQMADALKQMEATMKDMKPEQRKMMEQMMRSRMGQPAGGATQECREPTIELRPTGQTATIAGFQAVRHDVLADGKPESQVWVARALTAWREIDPQKLQRFGTEMGKLAACSPGPRGLGGASAWRAASEGYPVRTVDPSGATLEVVKAESRAVPAAEFQAPAGFARKTLAETMGR